MDCDRILLPVPLLEGISERFEPRTVDVAIELFFPVGTPVDDLPAAWLAPALCFSMSILSEVEVLPERTP